MVDVVGDRLDVHFPVELPAVRHDAFGRLRVSQQDTRFDSQLQYDGQPLLWHELTESGGSSVHLPDESAVGLVVGTTSGARVVRQSKEYFRYQPGKSQQIFCTGTFGPSQENTTKLIGYGDDANGVFFGMDGGGAYVLLRNSAGGSVDDSRKVYQSDWNGDTFDRLGTSRLQADWSKAQIFTFDLEWLGVGSVRCGLVVDGEFITVHTFNNANIFSTVYMTTANLPVRYEIKNTGTAAGASTLKQICCQVSSEGGVGRLQSFPFSARQVGTSIPNGAGSASMIYAIRHAATFNGVVNRALFRPEMFAAMSDGGSVYISVLYNPTLTGGTFAAHDPSSVMESALDVGTAFSGGIEIGHMLVSGSASQNTSGAGEVRGFSSRLPFGLDIGGSNPIALGFVAYALSTQVTADLIVEWKEVR